MKNLGVALNRTGSVDEAIEIVEESVEIFRHLNDRAAEGSSLVTLGSITSEAGRLDEAYSAFSRAIDVYLGIGDRVDATKAWDLREAVFRRGGGPPETQ
ncbi:tetratricopeptide repeat protein [Streptomyces lasiicapitis]|uniref:tetratricopeptide repeat protein n=1 Tax=Streptomyces lasiicapitis TaxID=1923961 RepID=UPI00364BE3BC